MTLFEKLQGQLFWDHCGNEKPGTRASPWVPSRIREINGIQELGIVAMNGDAVTLCTERKFIITLHRSGMYELRT